MALYGPPAATATVTANTNSVAIAGMDLSLITPGMTINFGARGRKTGDAFIISAVAPSGSNGGTVTTQESVPTAYSSAPFVIDTTGYLGTDASYAAAVGLTILSTLSTLLGVATNLYSGARQIVLDKVASSALSRIVFSIAGRSWGDIVQRAVTYTPSGGQAINIETIAVRAFPDGSTPTDALLFDLGNGTGDLRKGAATMAAAATVDLGSAPAGKVAITGTATISSFGPGRHLERLVHFVGGGGTLKHNATSLILPGRADILIQAGDWLHATSDGSGNWRIGAYERANGQQVAFQAVQQSGGAGQLAGNKIYLGWSGSALRGQVDSLDLGQIWADNLGAVSLNENGYAKLPNGLILQWGRTTNQNPDFRQTLNIANNIGLVFAGAFVELSDSNNVQYTCRTDQYDRQGFAIRARTINGGSVVGFANNPIRWFALGF